MKLDFRQRLLTTTLIVGAGMVATPAFAQNAPPPCPAGSTVDATGTCVKPATSDQGQISSPTETSPGPNPGTTTPTGTIKNANQGTGQEEIVVTGSLLRRTNTETPSPVTVLSSETLNDRGINTVADAVTRLPANGAGTVPQGWNVGFNFASGASAISLRGLTVQSTLTIFDGMRMAYYPFGDDGRRNFVDANSIPDAVVDRVEVLRDGASSTYGSDAIAGVVNIITKKEIQGLHLNGSYGFAQHGGGKELRLDATAGFGDLARDGINAYVSVEYQKTDPIWARDRDYPFNSADWSKYCNASDSCLFNAVVNGVEANGIWNGLGATIVPVIRPYNAAQTAAQGVYRVASGNCDGLTPVTLNDTQQRGNNPNNPLIYDPLQCQQDLIKDYRMNQAEQTRRGIFGRVTANIADNIQGFLEANYYEVKTHVEGNPASYTTQTAAGGTRVAVNPFFLPVYICPLGTPYAAGSQTRLACDATTPGSQLNPYNPFAANGQAARLVARYDRPTIQNVIGRTYHVAAGVNGTFLDDWRWGVNATASRIDVTRQFINYFINRNLIVAKNSGLFDFLNPANNTQAQRDFIAPEEANDSNSKLWQIDGTLSKDLFQLPGGPLAAAIGAQYRKESINNPSANPVNNVDPYARYQTINAVGAEGSRNAKSAYFEISAPLFSLANNGFGAEVDVSGRYDKYSTGQKNFSPKFGAKITPIRELALRGTWSKGFRVPSFNESFGLPTTGYIGHRVDCTKFAAYCAAHGGNAYATGPYSYGLTATGNPSLKPEKSTSYTLGVIFEPIKQLSFTVDYWHIKIKDLVSGIDYTGIPDLYYANNGVVNIPGVIVGPGAIDLANPNALPQLGTIEYSYQNADQLQASGVDFGAIGRFRFGPVKWTSSLDVSYLRKNNKIFDSGAVQKYAGYLAPCDVTSCSGSPRWRGTWQNTVDIGRLKATLTSYYTSSMSAISTDYTTETSCEAAAGSSVVTYDNGGVFSCRDPKIIYHDLTASYKATDSVTIYGAVLNVTDKKPPFDPAAAYGLYGYNVAWAQSMFVGRYFRIGAKFDLNPRERPAPVYEAPPLPPPPPPAPATITCADGLVILANQNCPALPPPPPPPAPAPERGW